VRASAQHTKGIQKCFGFEIAVDGADATAVLDQIETRADDEIARPQLCLVHGIFISHLESTHAVVFDKPMGQQFCVVASTDFLHHVVKYTFREVRINKLRIVISITHLPRDLGSLSIDVPFITGGSTSTDTISEPVSFQLRLVWHLDREAPLL